MRQQLVIAVKDQDYIKRLADYVRDSPFGQQWQLTAFTHPEAFVQFIKSGSVIHGIVAQPALLEAGKELLPAGVPAVALVTAKGQCPGYEELLQFQALPALLQGIASYMAGSSHHVSQEQAVNIVAVYSASGGVGKTTLARQLMQTASSHGQRVFYLNMERWNAMDVWLAEADASSGEEGLSQLLYTLQSHPAKAGEWLNRHSKRNAVFDYILPCSNPEDRMTLQATEAAAIVQTIRESGRYDLILIDLDEGQEELHLTLLELCHLIIWLESEDPAIQRKSQLAYQYGMQRWGERYRAVERRIQLVVNRSEGRFEAGQAGRSYSFRHAVAALPEVGSARMSSSSVMSSPAYKAAVERLFLLLFKEEGGAAIAER